MSFGTVAVVLCAALLHAIWNALVKRGGDRLLALASVSFVGLLMAVVLIPWVRPPHQLSWVFLGVSVVLHAGYHFFLLQSYRFGDLSHVYPLARGMAPLLVAGGAALLADEWLSRPATVGVLLACVGIISLAFENGRPWKNDSRPLVYSMGTSGFIAAYTVMDGMGVRASASPLGYICWLFLLDGLILTLFALWRRRMATWSFLQTEWRIYIVGGIAATSAYGLVIYVMSFGALAIVSALRETSVIFAALIGMLMLGERFSIRRIVAAVLVACGVAVMHFLG
ncbi:MAG: DMT family transporter [Gammaproteobacteria bacterium]|nr:DMT family transporter [Gammaproteobacteria bacterium]